MNVHLPNRPYSEIWKESADAWADLDNAARLLEETKSSVLAKWMTEIGDDVPVNRAEREVKSSERWHDYVERTVRARTAAEKAKIEMEFVKMRYFEAQSKAATERTEARL